MFYIFPYTQNSAGAIALAEELEGKRILREGSSYKFKEGHTIINWGASDCPYPQALNHDIRPVLDKLKFFERLQGTGLTPDYRTHMSTAGEMNYPIFCRTKTKGRDGAGIVIADNSTEIVPAPLYVQGVNKTAEYRIHIGRLPNGEVRVIGAQKKRKKIQTPEMTNIPSDPRIWCGDTTGFIWKLGGFPIFVPQQVSSVVHAAFAKFPELTFGGFDVVFNEGTNKAYVIEINSAPMATPETTKRYASFFRDYVDSLNSIAAEPQPSSPTMTIESVIADLSAEKISINTIIEGYIKSCQ